MKNRGSAVWMIGRYVILAVAGLMFLFPLIWMIVGSLKNINTYFERPIQLFFTDPQWSNYADVIQRLRLPQHTLNSIIVAGSIAVLQVLTSAPAAFAFATMRFPMKGLLFAVVITTLMLPASVMLVPLFMIVQRMGLVNTYSAMILPFGFTGFGIFLVRQTFLAMPHDLFAASEIDGASYFRIMWQIYTPLAKPTLMTLLVLSFINNFNSVLWPQITTSSPDIMVLSVRLIAALNFDTMMEPYKFMAIATICIVPPVVLFASMQRLYVNGYVMSGLKG